MAVVKLSQIERFVGTAAERAAMSVVGVSPGSTFFERDTGDMYLLDGSGNWGKKNISGTISVTDLNTLATQTTLEAARVLLDSIDTEIENKNNMTRYGATLAARPAADAVTVGTTFTLTNADLETWISDGTNWVEV